MITLIAFTKQTKPRVLVSIKTHKYIIFFSILFVNGGIFAPVI